STRLSRVPWRLRWRSPPETCRVVGVGHPPRSQTRRGPPCRRRSSTPPPPPQRKPPEQVTVAVTKLAGAAREGLLALAVGTGLQVLQAMLAEDVARLVGPQGGPNPPRAAVRAA